MKTILVLTALLASSVAVAEKKEPAHHKQARAFLRTLLESKDNPPAKKLSLYLQDTSDSACKGVGDDVVDAAGMTKLKACVKAIKKAFTDKVDEVASGDITVGKLVADMAPPVAKEVKAMVKNTKLVTLGFNGNGETLNITVALAKDGTVKALLVASEAVE